MPMDRPSRSRRVQATATPTSERAMRLLKQKFNLHFDLSQLWVVFSTCVGLLAAALLLACSSEPVSEPERERSQTPSPPIQAAGQPDSASVAPPRIDSLRLEPVRPKPDEPVRAVASVRGADGVAVDIDFEWKLKGKTLRAHGDSVRFPASRKGDRIEVIATATDPWGRISRATAVGRVDNRSPVIMSVNFPVEDEISPGQNLEASVEARDPDGDGLRFSYDWRINGRRSSVRDSSLPTQGLKRGDEIQLSVRADDGDDHSDLFVSRIVRIGNSPPEIVSEPGNDSNQDSFFYQVQARDPDHDRGLIYSLVRAPDGMSINRLGGELTWRPQSNQGGVHVVTVRVEDRHGGASTQTFELTITDEVQSQEIAAAAR